MIFKIKNNLLVNNEIVDLLKNITLYQITRNQLNVVINFVWYLSQTFISILQVFPHMIKCVQIKFVYLCRILKLN